MGERDERCGGTGGADFGSAMGTPPVTRGGPGWGGGRWRVVPPESPTRATGMGELACGIFFEGNTAMEAPAVTLLKKQNAPRLWHLFTSLLETTD